MAIDAWTIVLAAGAGRRLATVTGGIPKQYWRPEGSQSLLEDTLARLRGMSAPERTITVVAESHRTYVETLPGQWALGEVMYQPADRGTAVGLLLALAAVNKESPDATVVVTPCDHGIEDAECFRRGIRRGLQRVQAHPENVVLFGVEPTSASSDFGWITPAVLGMPAHSTFSDVAAVVERPPVDDAAFLYWAGGVWNTMVIVARASALLALCRRALPFHTDVMTAALEMPPVNRVHFLRDWYPELSVADVGREVLTSATNLCLFTWPAEMGWSDLGTPDRMAAWLALQRRPLGLSLSPTDSEHAT